MNDSEASSNGIAVIGLAGRFPRARNVEAFWRNLRDGVEAISFFTDEELREAGAAIPEGNLNYVKARALLEGAENFDAEFFGINPKEAEIMDPQHRVFLECAWEAMEDGGYAGKRDDRLVGVYAGMSMNTYLLTNLCSRPDVIDLVGAYQIMLANDKDYLPTRVSYKLNLRGPSVNIQTACSTSLVAVCVACEQLLNYQCDMALAGGVSVTFPQKRGYLYQEGGISSPDGHCRAFDAKAQGTVAGDGVGIVLLKRLGDAIEDGDHVYAVIKGFATNNDGALKAGFTAPSPDGQAEAIALAQAVAGIDPRSIGYVVAHGTGTPIGDPIEIEGLTKAFRAGTDARQFCALTSVKTNIGHLDAAAGIAGLLNAILALHHQEIPPNVHFESPNPKIDFIGSPFFVNARLRDWKSQPGALRHAAVSAFGIGGTNAHVILEEAPKQKSAPGGRPANLLLLSAQTEQGLAEATERLAVHLETNSDSQLADVAYTLSVGRAAFQKRRAVVCRQTADAITALRTIDPKRVTTAVAGERPSVIFMFPGQGAQHVNMGAELYRNERVFREQIDICAESLKTRLGFDLREILYPAKDKSEEAAQRLTQTAVAQPALFVIEYAMAKLWMSWGLEPAGLIGHSIGEYVAACIAGVFALRDGLDLVALRGKLMQSMPHGAMLAVRLPQAELETWRSPEISVAAINSPVNSVVSGPLEAIDALAGTLQKKGVVAKRLHTSHAFHSAMMDPIRGPFIEAVKRIHLRSPGVRYISNLTGAWITPDRAMSADYWADHLRQTVRFFDGLSELLKPGAAFLLEAGPGRTLSSFALQHSSRHAGHVVATSLPHVTDGQPDDYAAMLQAAGQLWTAGGDLDWRAFYGNSRRRVPLPTYPFQQKRFWIEPGRQLLASPTRTETATHGSESQTPVAECPATLGPSPSHQSDLVAASLKSLFSQLSGLSVGSIDSRTSFTELGFDSLFLTQVSQAVEKQFGLKVPFGDLLDRFSTLDLLTSHISGAPKDETVPGHQQTAPNADRAPLTEAQKEIWFAAQHGNDASCAFNESNMLHLRGEIDVDALRKSIQALVDRHESLRITFSPDGEYQEVQPALPLELPLIDLAASNQSERQTQLQSALREEARKPFDLVKGPLLRCRLIRLESDLTVLLITVHHLVCDGASLGILFKEMSELYGAERRKVPGSMAPVTRYVDYARKQANAFGTPENQAAERYWLDQFKTLPPTLDLPLDLPRSMEVSFDAGWEFRPLNPELCRELNRLSARQKSTLFVTFLTAYYVFLHRLTSQEEIVVGIPMARRSQPGDEKLVGHCINFLPLRSRIRAEMRFTDYLAEVRSAFLEAFEHQSYTFGTLVQKLQLPRDRNRIPLLAGVFNLVWVRSGINFPGLEAEIKPNPSSFSNFDLTFNITETDGAFALDCSYKSDLLTGSTVKRWMSYFEALLENIAADPEQAISKLSLVPKSNRDEVLSGFNETRVDYPCNALVHELIEAQARRTPEAVAITSGQRKVTYLQLITRANRLAAQLQNAGVIQNLPVALCMPVCLEMLIAVLAVLKAGGALITLQGSPAEPWNRAVINKSAVLLGPPDIGSQLGEFAGKVLPVNLAEESQNLAEAAPSTNLAAESIALIVPSGTVNDLQLTGFSHRALVNVISWLLKNLSPGEGASTLQLKHAGTERLAHEIFTTWCGGGRLIASTSDTDHTLYALPELIAREQPERVFLTETQLSTLAKSLANESGKARSVRDIIVHAGKPPLSSDLKVLKEQLPSCAILVLYGTGRSGVVTAFRPNGSIIRQHRTPLGQPIHNVRVLILDAELNPVPVGVPGRLFVGGDSIARDYRNDQSAPLETQGRDAKITAGSDHLVETGDCARYLADGTIELVRTDSTTPEMAGWSISMPSLQRALSKDARFKDAVVTVREDALGEKLLVAYVIPTDGQGPAESDVVQVLRAQLPSTNIPSAVVFLEQLPTLLSGAIDYSRLPVPRQMQSEPPAFVKPRNTTEKLLAQIWCEVIGLNEVGVTEDFFDLGGHSVLVTQIVARIRKAFDVDIGLQPIFEKPTIAELAQTVEKLVVEQIGSLTEEEAHQLARGTDLFERTSQ